MTTRTDRSRAVLRQVAVAAGLSVVGARPIRLAENDIWRLPDGVVVRISREGQEAAAAREVAVARWLADAGVRAVRPLPMAQPVRANGRAATFWEELPPHRRSTEAELAPLLRQLHDLPIPAGAELGALDPFVRIETRIRTASCASEDDQAFLLDRLAVLQADWAALPPGRPERVVHGDAWTGNCVVDEDGRAFLLDFERTALGRPEWDLTSTAVALDTFGRISPTTYEEYCAAYGYDVRDGSGYPTMRSIRELRATTVAFQLASQGSVPLSQAQYRLACLRGDHGPRPWKWSTIS